MWVWGVFVVVCGLFFFFISHSIVIQIVLTFVLSRLFMIFVNEWELNYVHTGQELKNGNIHLWYYSSYTVKCHHRHNLWNSPHWKFNEAYMFLTTSTDVLCRIKLSKLDFISIFLSHSLPICPTVQYTKLVWFVLAIITNIRWQCPGLSVKYIAMMVWRYWQFLFSPFIIVSGLRKIVVYP